MNTNENTSQLDINLFEPVKLIAHNHIFKITHKVYACLWEKRVKKYSPHLQDCHVSIATLYFQ